MIHRTPCLLITQSPRLLGPSRSPSPAALWWRGSEGVPAYCGIHSSRFGFFPREAPMQILRLKSVALPTELPGLECQRDVFSVSFPNACVYPASTRQPRSEADSYLA